MRFHRDAVIAVGGEEVEEVFFGVKIPRAELAEGGKLSRADPAKDGVVSVSGQGGDVRRIEYLRIVFHQFFVIRSRRPADARIGREIYRLGLARSTSFSERRVILRRVRGPVLDERDHVRSAYPVGVGLFAAALAFDKPTFQNVLRHALAYVARSIELLLAYDGRELLQFFDINDHFSFIAFPFLNSGSEKRGEKAVFSFVISFIFVEKSVFLQEIRFIRAGIAFGSDRVVSSVRSFIYRLSFGDETALSWHVKALTENTSKKLENRLGVTPHGFESHPLRQKSGDAFLRRLIFM